MLVVGLLAVLIAVILVFVVAITFGCLVLGKKRLYSPSS